MQRIALDLQAEYDQKLQGVQQELDSRILAQRGSVRAEHPLRSKSNGLAAGKIKM